MEISNSCREKTWEQLPGDHQRRYCDRCGEFVHALRHYSPEQQRTLLSRPRKICVSLEPAPTRRVVFVAALFTALRPLWAETGRIRLVVKDATGAGVRDAKIHAQAGVTFVADVRTNDRGEAVVEGVPLATDVRLSVDAAGFKRPERLTARAGANIEVVLELGSGIGEYVHIQPVPSSRFRSSRRAQVAALRPPRQHQPSRACPGGAVGSIELRAI